MALPAAVEYGQVKWRAVSAVADSADVDELPDAVPVTGSVTFTPSAAVLLSMTGTPVTIIATAVTYQLDSDGVLRDSQGRDLITLVATNSAGITPTGWTWTVSYRLNNGAARGSFAFALPAGTTVDLTSVAPVSSSNGVQIIQGPAGAPGSAALPNLTAPVAGNAATDGDITLYTADGTPIILRVVNGVVGGGAAPSITLTDNGDGTFDTEGPAVTDNGDGTITLSDSSVTDNGDGTYTLAA